MQLINDTALKLTLPERLIPHITDNIEKSEVVERRGDIVDIMVYWGLHEMTKLNEVMKFKKNLPSPIVRDYNWPGLYKPFEHQIVTSEFLSVHKKAFCFNEAGTGKTSSVLWAADYLMNQGQIKRVLIVCPLSIMYSAWQGDIFNTCMHRTSAVCHGTRDKRVKIIDSGL
jgi:hypothetical protein